MTCAELPPTTRLEGAKILIVARVSERTIDLRQFDLTKLLVQHTDLNCDSIQAKASTKVFLGEKMCSFDSTESRSHQKISTTTLIVETVAISFNTPWIIAAVISSLIDSLIALSICSVVIYKKCVQRRRLARVNNAMNYISVTVREICERQIRLFFFLTFCLVLYILLRCIMLSSHPIPEPALATPREHQSEPGPVPALRRLRRVRRAPERLVY